MFTVKLVFPFAMMRLLLILFLCSNVLSAVIYIDRYTLDWNKKFGNWSTEFTHNEKRNAVVNLTFEMYKTMTKQLVYVKVNLAENEHDRECKRELVRTVVDPEKAFKGAQKNFFVAGFMANLNRFMDFDVIYPYQPVNI